MNGVDVTGTNAMAIALKKARLMLTQAGIFSCYVNLLMLTGPIYMLQIYDRVLGSRSIETLFVITLITFMLFAAMAGLDFARGALLSRAGAKFERQLRSLTFDIAMDTAREKGAGAEQSLKDLRQVRQFMSSPALTAVFDAPWTPIFLIVIFMMHTTLGIVASIGLIALVAFALVNERWSRNSNREAQGKAGEADRLAISAMRGAAAADAMGMRESLRRQWLNLNDIALANNTRASDVIGGMAAVARASRMFLQSAILGTGALLAINGEVSPGVMIAAAIIAGRALAPVEAMTGNWRNFANALTAYRRLRESVAATPPKRRRTKLPKPIGGLQVDRVFCRPGAASKPVLKNVSFQLEPGDAIGVVGASAAGKSTLGRAIVGVENLISGDIRLDGANISHWNPDALGRHIGYLPQEVELFAGTAAQNIARLDNRRVEDDEVIAAANAAGAHEMILAFDEGYDTEIGEGGRHLSAGQRQRLGLARALFGDPALVVLDEPNSNLDAEGDAALLKAVKTLKARGATTLIIAHRASGIADVDKLLLLVDGQVAAFGPRDEILQRITPGRIAPFGARPNQRDGANDGKESTA